MEASILLIIGLILICISLAAFISRYNLYKNGIRVVGIIKEIKETQEAILDAFNQISFVTIYKPVIEFTTEDGEKIAFTTDYTGNREDFNIGQEIVVVYDKKRKENIFLDKKFEFIKMPLTFLIIGAIFIAFSLTLYLINVA